MIIETKLSNHTQATQHFIEKMDIEMVEIKSGLN
jgi:hypothetical protein